MTDYSDNGWPVVDSSAVDNTVAVAGVTFPGGFRTGNVAAAFTYLFTQIHQRVEPIVAGWCWGFENRDNVNNPGSASCHSSATAGDYNAPNHPNGARNTWTSAQVAEIRQIMAECPAFLWGYDFTGTPDEMHWQIGNNLSDDDLARIVAGLPQTGDWFDMATEADLKKVVEQVLDEKMDDIQSAVWSYKESYKTKDGTTRTLSIHDMIGEIRGEV